MSEVLHELALFAGAGGGLLASTLLGWRTICAVEIDPYCRSILLDRQRDGCLPRFPIWDDVRTFDGRPWRGIVDVISGGFPCQNISPAGKGIGIAGEHSGLFLEMLRIIEDVRPRFVLAENSPHLRTKGLGLVVEGLTRLGYVGRVGVLGARHVGANHWRDRMWILGELSDADEGRERAIRQYDTDGVRSPQGPQKSRFPADTHGLPLWEQLRRSGGTEGEGSPITRITDWWDKTRFAGVDDGVANRMDRIKATGNGQVAGVAALAWSILTSDLWPVNPLEDLKDSFSRYIPPHNRNNDTCPELQENPEHGEGEKTPIVDPTVTTQPTEKQPDLFVCDGVTDRAGGTGEE